MTREPAEPLRFDYLIKAGAIHSMTGQTYRSVGIRGPEIVAASPEPGGLDDLAGGGTAVVDAGDLTVLPAFADSHEHLMEASRNTLLVPAGHGRAERRLGPAGQRRAGKLADLVAYPADPLTAGPDDLAKLTPAFTMVGGRAVHDPGGLLGS